jgi:hypothetical protein
MAFRHGVLSALLALAMMAPGAVLAAGSGDRAAPAAVGTIEVSHGSGGLTIKGGALALTDGDFQGTLTIDKEGRSGTMKTSQGGRLSLRAGESGSVARVGLSYQPGDRIDIRLEITSGGEPVSLTRTLVK